MSFGLIWTGIKAVLAPGSAVSEIGKAIVQAQGQKLDAATEQAKIAADEEIKTLEFQRDRVVAMSKDRWVVALLIFMTLPYALYEWKVVAVDKILCSTCATDPLAANESNMMFLVFGSWFGFSTYKFIQRFRGG